MSVNRKPGVLDRGLMASLVLCSYTFGLRLDISVLFLSLVKSISWFTRFATLPCKMLLVSC